MDPVGQCRNGPFVNIYEGHAARGAQRLVCPTRLLVVQERHTRDTEDNDLCSRGLIKDGPYDAETMRMAASRFR